MEDATAGDPIHGTKWTRKTLRKLVEELRHKKFTVSHETVRRLLRTLGYSLRGNRKALSKRLLADGPLTPDGIQACAEAIALTLPPA